MKGLTQFFLLGLIVTSIVLMLVLDKDPDLNNGIVIHDTWLISLVCFTLGFAAGEAIQTIRRDRQADKRRGWRQPDNGDYR